MVESSKVSLPPFQRFLEVNRISVYRFLVASVGPVDADDCFQETFMSALRSYARVEDPERLDRWVLKIASRKAIDHHRAAGKRPAPVAETPERAIRTELEPFDADEPLWRAVRSLPPRQRVAVVHRHAFDRSYAEVAALMGSTEATARANVHQGMKKLKELMG